MRISVARARAHSPDGRISILGAVRDADNKGASIPHCFHSASFFLVPISAGEMISLKGESLESIPTCELRFGLCAADTSEVTKQHYTRDGTSIYVLVPRRTAEQQPPQREERSISYAGRILEKRLNCAVRARGKDTTAAALQSHYNAIKRRRSRSLVRSPSLPKIAH